MKKVGQNKANTKQFQLYVKSKKTTQTKQIYRYRKQTGGHQKGGRRAGGVGQNRWRELRGTNLWNK